jgi:hypothetical protein
MARFLILLLLAPIGLLLAPPLAVGLAFLFLGRLVIEIENERRRRHLERCYSREQEARR